jgi:PAS domain S-box-containing protein
MGLLATSGRTWRKLDGRAAGKGLSMHISETETKLAPRISNNGHAGTEGKNGTTALNGAGPKSNDESRLLRALLEKSDDFIFFKDRQSRFTGCSLALARMYRLTSPADLIGKSDGDFYSAERAQAALADEQNIMRTGEPVIGKEEKAEWPDGRVTWVLTSKWPLRNDAGEIVGTFGLSRDITATKEAEIKIDTLRKRLADVSRQAGMAEVATSVLHNVGNVLNSVNVSSSLISERIRNSKVANLTKAMALMKARKQDLAIFLTEDTKGKQLPDYLDNLAAHLVQERDLLVKEAGLLASNIAHIKEIVAIQQDYAKASGLKELLDVRELVEDALRMNNGAMLRHNVKVTTEFSDAPRIWTEKHKVLQILINLIRNAKYACDDSGKEDKQMTLRVAHSDGRLRISVIDNGIGIPPENLSRVFGHGFTTRKDGHGFGLHSGAAAAKELGGTLTVASDGVGRGAAFTLELPITQG